MHALGLQIIERAQGRDQLVVVGGKNVQQVVPGLTAVTVQQAKELAVFVLQTLTRIHGGGQLLLAVITGDLLLQVSEDLAVVRADLGDVFLGLGHGRFVSQQQQVAHQAAAVQGVAHQGVGLDRHRETELRHVVGRVLHRSHVQQGDSHDQKQHQDGGPETDRQLGRDAKFVQHGESASGACYDCIDKKAPAGRPALIATTSGDYLVAWARLASSCTSRT